jgi:EmrB/QacA subfamily drug resistance transporter
VSDVQTAPQPKNLRVILFALAVTMLLAMLDNTIVGTALPRIIGELRGDPAHLSWVVTAYILGSTVSTPIWGKIGDLYGRKSIFITSVVIFLVGSALCGLAGEFGGGVVSGMTQLIAFRALQGLGAGGLFVGVMAIIGDLVSPRERGKYVGMFAAIMAVAMIAGPLTGGFLTDNLSWRWAFYINLPLGAIALFMLVTKMHLPKFRSEHRIDWWGAALLSTAVTAVVLLTTWGGNEYAWGSPQILGLAGLVVVSTVAFLFLERRVPEPILPLGVFANRNFALVTVIGLLVGAAMFGAITFLPLYQQTVQGASATNSGLLLLPMMGGMLVTSVTIGQAISRTGRYRIFPIVGGVVLTVGLLLLAQLDSNTSKTVSALYMVVVGVGMGLLMQTTMLIAQNSVDPKDMGVASSTSTFFRNIGGSFGVSLLGAIFASRLRDELTARLGEQAAGSFSGGSGNIDPAALDRLPAPVRASLIDSISLATASIFFWGMLIAVAIPVLAWFIKEVPLRGPSATETPAETVAETVEPASMIDARSA